MPSLADLMGRVSRLRVGALLQPLDEKPGQWMFYLGKSIKTGPGEPEDIVAKALKLAEKSKPEGLVPEPIMRASFDRARKLAGLPAYDWDAKRDSRPRIATPPPPPPVKVRPPVPVPVKVKPKPAAKKKSNLDNWSLF
jgi:hypothetical protein